MVKWTFYLDFHIIQGELECGHSHLICAVFSHHTHQLGELFGHCRQHSVAWQGHCCRCCTGVFCPRVGRARASCRGR